MSKRFVEVNLEGLTALVTGSAKGIGAAIATALADNGAAVAVNYLSSADKARRLVDGLMSRGKKAVAVQADVADADAVEQMMGQAVESLGGEVDILVNNAGSQVSLRSAEDMTLDLWDRVLAINLTGAMLCSKAAIPGMKRKRWGRIINVSSISARSGGGPGGIAYASSKGGMSAFTKGLAKELGPFGVTVNAVAPGVILTDVHKEFSTPESLQDLEGRTPVGRHGVPEDVSGAALFLASDSASFVTGEILAVNGGLRMD